MVEKSEENAKRDVCLDLTVRRTLYSSLAGFVGGLIFFRSPVTRWASIAFGAGVGIGSAYTECSPDGIFPRFTRPKSSDASATQEGQDSTDT